MYEETCFSTKASRSEDEHADLEGRKLLGFAGMSDV